MARPQAQLDLCHVATPDCVIDWLGGVLNIPDGCHVLDPCCGTGEAVRRLAPKGEIYGIELDGARERAARGRLNYVLGGAMQDARITGRFGLLFLNPPYDKAMGGRLEHIFLRTCTRVLAPHGVLVLIIKEGQYDYNIKDVLERHYETVAHLRFPAGYYNGPHLSFHQTVLIATKRPFEHRVPTNWYGSPVHGSFHPRGTIGEDEIERVDVPTGSAPTTWESEGMGPDEAELAMRQSGLNRFQDPPPLVKAGRPPLPLKRGHLALTLASGVINGIYGEGDDRHVAKGTVSRGIDRKVEVKPGEREATVIVTDTDKFEVAVRIARCDGEIVTLK